MSTKGLKLVFLFALGCHEGALVAPGDLSQDDRYDLARLAPASAATADCDTSERKVIFESPTGYRVDLTDTWTAGTASAVAEITHSLSGTITICPGTYYVSVTFSNAAVALVGPGGADETVLNGGRSERVLSTRHDISIEGLTIESGQAPIHEYGGGLNVYRGDADITDAIFLGNSAVRGGAIAFRQGTHTLDGVVIRDGYAPPGYSGSSGEGGGLWADAADITATDLTMHGNDGSYGGAVHLSNSTMVIEDSDISLNAATHRGGGIYLYASSLELDTSTVTHNEGGSYGGGLYLGPYSTFACVGSTGGAYGVWGNAADAGGGLYAGSTSGLGVTSTDCDWDGDRDNDPTDLAISTTYSYDDLGDNEDFTCGSSGCS